MPVSLRALGATAALTTSLALSACGGDDGGGKDLTKAQYDKLAQVFEKRVIFERLPYGERNAGRYEAASKPLLDACNGLAARNDDVLYNVRLTCAIPAQLAGQLRILGLCDQRQELCTEAVPEIRKLLAQFIRNGREANDAIEDLGLAPDCADVLKVPEEQERLYQAYGRAFTVFEEAQTTRSRAGAARAQKMLVKADEQAKEVPTAPERLKDFRDACDPA